MLPVDPRIATLDGSVIDMVSTKCLTPRDLATAVAPRNLQHRQIPTAPSSKILGFVSEFLNVKPCSIVVSGA